MSAELHEGQTVRFPFSFVDENGDPLDISIATLWIDLRKPDGAVDSKTPTLTNDGSDGLAEYTTVATDLVGTGEWELQGWAIIASQKYPSDIHRFPVRSNLVDR